MKIIALSLLLVVWSPKVFSQKNLNLYILYNKNSHFLTNDLPSDSIQVRTYSFTFKVTPTPIRLEIDDKGQIRKKRTIITNRQAIIQLMHINNRGKNNPILVKKSDVVNSLTFDELTQSVSPEDYFKIVEHFKDIYVIDTDETSQDLYIARRVADRPPYEK